ncbi:MAG: ABC-type Fe3+-hydroxamate transport system, periplasmic component [Bacteroidetes bacterium]|jgi:ABC-type Fe3+-hydroxamate transport system substrate-binding protein|nr:ABC-type Fe3+-hydroxamate transport system, periplasmic component [Bacteroidota bacterium]
MQFTDQTGRTIELNATPRRIVSVVPSQSELLWDLGLQEELTGITKFCIHPKEMFSTKTRIGGTKKLDIAKIKELNPDIIIANKEENEKEQIEELCRLFPVWISDIKNLSDSLDMITNLGAIFEKRKTAEKIRDLIAKGFAKLPIQIVTKRTAYFIWKNPLMMTGRDTFINDMLSRCGFENILNDPDSRYPEISEKELRELNPELILLSSEPYPFNEKHIHEFQAIVPEAKIRIVDGELFSWYGSRLIHSPAYFENLNQEL